MDLAHGTLPDVITFREKPVQKFFAFPPTGYDPGPYEARSLIIGHIKNYTGANYRIAYGSAEYVRVGLNPLYQGRALILQFRPAAQHNTFSGTPSDGRLPRHHNSGRARPVQLSLYQPGPGAVCAARR
jgi:hypothetical protein